MHITLPDGTVVHYSDDPATQDLARPALLLVHGGSLSLTSWRPWISRLRGRRRIVAVDMPGHGGTGATRSGDYAPEGMVKFLATFSQAVGLDRPFVLAGHSMGGHICWRFALAHPGRLAGLILVAPAGLARPEGAAGQAISIARRPGGSVLLRLFASRGRLEAGLKENIFDPAFLTCEMVEEWWQASRRAGLLRASVARLRAPFAKPAVIARLGEIRARTLIQWGEQDNVFPLELGERMARQIPNSQFLTYACCRHIPILEHPDRTADDADAFMDSL
jgi:pimeloyl-ACP methyl ester carboxylesterase